MENGSYESSDPDRYAQALDLCEEFDALPEGENKEKTLARARVLNVGTEPDRSNSIGMVEAIAQAMQEAKAVEQSGPNQPQ